MLKNMLRYIAGIALGSGVTYYICKGYYNKKIQEEVNAMRDEYVHSEEKVAEIGDLGPSEGIVEETVCAECVVDLDKGDENPEAFNPEIAVNYSKMFVATNEFDKIKVDKLITQVNQLEEEIHGGEEDSKPMGKKKIDYDPIDELYPDEEPEVVENAPDIGPDSTEKMPPHPCGLDEFTNDTMNNPHYERQIILYYVASNDIVYEDSMEPVDNPDILFGPNWKDEFTVDIDEVCFVNDFEEKYFDILVDEGECPYSY